MFDKITLDREAFKVLAADTRIEILKRLERHKETLSDMAEGMSMSPSTVKEHLDRLSQAGLVEKEDTERKWKYYRLTSKGRSILKPHENRVWFLLAVSIFLLTGSLYRLATKLALVFNEEPVFAAAEAARETAPQLAAAPAVSFLPYTEIALVVLFALLSGLFAGYLLRK